RREFSVARTLQQNIVAKRKNRTLIDTARTMLADSELPTTFWAEAVNTTCYVQNKTIPGPQYVLLPLLISDSQGLKSPEGEVTDDAGKKSTEVPRKENGVQDLAKEGLKSSEGEVADDAGKKSTEVPRKENGVQDLAKEGEAANTNSTNRLNTVSSPVNAVSSSFTTVDPGREIAQRNEFKSMFGQDKDANGNKIFTLVSAARSTYVNLSGSIPLNAATLPNDDFPTDPLMPDLEDNADLHDTRIFSGTYDDKVEGVEGNFNNLELTIVVSPIPTTRIFKDHLKEQIIGDPLLAPQTRRMTKTSQEHAMKDKRGIIVRNKARLVTQGYTQEEGIYYDEVFAPVARIEAIRLFLAYASFMGFIVYQMDVKSAFLYGTIEEEVINAQEVPDEFYKGAHFLLRVAGHAER
nr:putative ribonuclease H-like domain-containing protein [Tanacetum cinerariifolium]